MQTSDTPESARVRSIMASGGYISDEMTAGLVAERLNGDDCRPGFLLDGYPRTLPQLETLDGLLARNDQRLDAVISLKTGIADINTRLTTRAKTDGRLDDTPKTIDVRQRAHVPTETRDR